MTVAEALGCIPAVVADTLGGRVLEKCLRQAGLPENVSERVGFHLPQAAVNRFLEGVAQNAGDDLYGLFLAEHLTVKEYGAWGDHVLEAADLGSALERAVQIIHLHANRDRLEVRRGTTSTFFRYKFGEPCGAGYRQTALAAVGSMTSIPRHFLGHQWQPLSIGLDLDDTSSNSRIETHLGTKVRCDLDCIYLEIANSDLLARNPSPQPGCTTIADVMRASNGGPPQDLVPCVQHLILQELGSQPISLDHISRIMGMSGRSLQRRLEMAGTSFRSIHTDAKMRKAAELLIQTSATVSSIALELDYSTASHFSRAFRKQFGTSPFEFRNSRPSYP